ncbi:MAG: hypothetical protein JWM98_1006, partial [Thermoleophilia bacterium]|nr:hypothetical protein [Thermoleophilia bacterium]
MDEPTTPSPEERAEEALRELRTTLPSVDALAAPHLAAMLAEGDRVAGQAARPQARPGRLAAWRR